MKLQITRIRIRSWVEQTFFPKLTRYNKFSCWLEGRKTIDKFNHGIWIVVRNKKKNKISRCQKSFGNSGKDIPEGNMCILKKRIRNEASYQAQANMATCGVHLLRHCLHRRHRFGFSHTPVGRLPFTYDARRLSYILIRAKEQKLAQMKWYGASVW